MVLAQIAPMIKKRTVWANLSTTWASCGVRMCQTWAKLQLHIINVLIMMLHWHWYGIRRVKLSNMYPYYFAPMILNKNKDYLTLFEPHVRSTWASLGSYLSAIAAMHPTIIADNSTWHWNGIRRVKFPNMCSYDFAPMILLLWFLTKTRTKPHVVTLE